MVVSALQALLEASVLVMVAVGTRIPFLLAPSSDKATQLWIMEAFAKNRRIAPLLFPDSLRQGMLGYPPLPHFFLSFAPRHMRSLLGAALNIAADVVHVLVIYAALLALLPKPAPGGGPSMAAAFALLFATLPILHPNNARLSAVGSRTIGPLLFTLYALAVHGAHASGAGWLLLLCLPIGILIILTSQFALQALVGLSVSLSIWLLSALPALALVATMVIGAMVPGLNIASQLRAKLDHYRWYGSARNLHVDLRNSMQHLRRVAAGGGMNGLVKSVGYLLTSSTPVIVLLGVGTAAGLVAHVWLKTGLPDDPFVRFATGVCAAGLLMCALTFRGPLRILGEAERYIEYTVPFLVLLAAVLYAGRADNASLPLLLALANIPVALVQWAILNARALRQSALFLPGPDLASLAEFLDHRGGRRVVTSPLFLASSLALVTKKEHKYLHTLVVDEDGRFSHWYEDVLAYPHLRGDTQHYVKRYGADTMVLERQSLEAIRRIDPGADVLSHAYVFQNDVYVALDLAPAQR
jgi:hypothetical protein